MARSLVIASAFALATAQVPNRPPTFQMNKSTLIMRASSANRVAVRPSTLITDLVNASFDPGPNSLQLHWFHRPGFAFTVGGAGAQWEAARRAFAQIYS
jgi:hypothetical protein